MRFVPLAIFMALAVSFSIPLIKSQAQAEEAPKVSLVAEIKGTPKQVARVQRLVKVAELVVNSPKYAERTKAVWWKAGKKPYSYSDLTGAQVYELNMKAAELRSSPDGVWNLVYEFKEQPRKCIGFGRFKKCTAWVNGWTYPSVKVVYFNSLIWDSRDDCGIVGTIIHEQQHKLGLTHPSESTKSRPFSPPYTQGTIGAELCHEFLAMVI